MWRKGNPLALLVGMQIDTPTMEDDMEIPLKTRNKTTIWPSDPNPRHIPWGNQNWKRHMYPNVYCSTIYNSHNMEATYISTDKWMDKEVVVHIHNGMLLSHKKNIFESVLMRWMNLEWSKSERER